RLAQQANEARRIENLVALSREVIARRRVAIEPLPRTRLRPEDRAAGALAARRGPRLERPKFTVVASDQNGRAGNDGRGDDHRSGRKPPTLGARARVEREEMAVVAAEEHGPAGDGSGGEDALGRREAPDLL